MKTETVLAFAISLVLLSSCSESPQITGGGSDHPNEIVATLLKADGTPASFSPVSLYRKDAFATINVATQFDLFDSATTDANGAFTFSLPDGVFALEAATPDSSEVAFISHIVVEPKKRLFLVDRFNENALDTLLELQTIPLRKASSLSGSIVSGHQKRIPLQVELAGIPRVATVDGQGKFKFNHLPPRNVGLLTLHFEKKDTTLSFNLSRRLNPGEHLKLSPIVLESKVITLDDFEDGDGQISLASLFNGGWWYSYQQPWGVILKHPGGLTDFSKAIAKVDGSNALHVALKFPDDSYITYPPLAIIGFNLGAGYIQHQPLVGKSFFDLSKATALSFKAQGVGKARVQFAAKATKEADGWGHFYSDEFSLPNDGYQTVNISLDSLMPPPGSMADSLKMKWKEVRDQVYAIDFMFTTTSEIWLDDLKLVGLEITDL